MIIAEIGWNFLGNLDLAKQMIDRASEAGCTYIKFQIWNPKNLVEGPWDNDGRREIYNKAYLDKDRYTELYNYCNKKKLICFASVFDDDGYKILKSVSTKFIKIPSVEAYDVDLIKRSLNDFENVIVSTGALKKKELDDLIKLNNYKNLTLLHCVSSYPLNYENINFEKFHYIKRKFNNVGYSGHAEGIEDALYALSHGATIIEKHFTIDNSLEGRDNKFAILPFQLKIICEFEKKIKLIKKNKKENYGLQKIEEDVYSNYRGRWKN